MSNGVREIQGRVRRRARIYRVAAMAALIVFVSSPVVWIRFFGTSGVFSVLAAVVLVSAGWWLLAFLAETALHMRYKLFGVAMALAGIFASRLLGSALIADLLALGTVVLTIAFARKAVDLDVALRDLLADWAPFRRMESFASHHSFTAVPLLVFGHVVALLPSLVALLMLQLGDDHRAFLVIVALLPVQGLWLWMWARLVEAAATDTSHCRVDDMRCTYNEILSAALREHGMRHEYIRESHEEREWGYDSMLSVTVLDAIHHYVVPADSHGSIRRTPTAVLAIVESESHRIAGLTGAEFRPSSGLVLRPADEPAQIRLQAASPTLEKMLGESVNLTPVRDKAKDKT